MALNITPSLDRIADAIQCPVRYEGGKVTGKAMATYTALPGIGLRVELRAVKVFTGASNGVLFHVMGDLYLLASHFTEANTLSVFMLDGSKHDDITVKINLNVSLRDLIASLRSSIVDSYLYARDTKTWAHLKLPV